MKPISKTVLTNIDLLVFKNSDLRLQNVQIHVKSYDF